MRWWPKAVKQVISKYHVFLHTTIAWTFHEYSLRTLKKYTHHAAKILCWCRTWWKMCENAMENKETKTNGSKIIHTYTFIFFAFAHADPILLHPNSIHTQCSLTKREKKLTYQSFSRFRWFLHNNFCSVVFYVLSTFDSTPNQCILLRSKKKHILICEKSHQFGIFFLFHYLFFIFYVFDEKIIRIGMGAREKNCIFLHFHILNVKFSCCHSFIFIWMGENNNGTKIFFKRSVPWKYYTIKCL